MRKKNMMFLIDTALNYVNFFKNLSSKIDNYANCFYACESHFPEVRYNSFINSNNKFYYSNYKINTKKFKYDINISNLDEKYNLRKGYFSDFDRHQWFNFRRDLDERADQEIEYLINYFMEIIKDNNIDYIVYENVSNIFSFAAYIAAKELGIKYIGFIVSKIPSTYDIWFDMYGNIDKINEDFNRFDEDKLSDEVKSYINNYYKECSNKKPEYLKNDIKSYNINYFKYYLNKIGLIKNYTMYTIGNKEDRKNSLGMDNPIINSIKSINRNITRKIKIRHLNNFKNKYFDKVEEGESFALYPLHFQPESSTSVNAMYFVNQYEVIKNVAFSMPIGMKLYVKDHPHAFGYFSLDFYKKIKRIPNVKLIHCDENVNLLVNKMKFLVTLTGTMGYEALLQKKPILSFGKISYNVHPYCFNISRYEDIFDTIKKILKSNYDKFDEYNKRLIYAYKNNVYNGILVMYDYTKSSMDLIAENLINILQDGEKNV